MNDPTPQEPTKAELLERARELDVKGRTKMNEEELVSAIADAERDSLDPSQRPGTPEQVGRPPLDEVAVQSAIDRQPFKVIGAPDPAYEGVSDAPELTPDPNPDVTDEAPTPAPAPAPVVPNPDAGEGADGGSPEA